MGAVGLISCAPFFILWIIPDLTKHQSFLNLLLAFAAGGLLGDAFLHLIPHALDETHEHGSTGHGDHHSHSHHDQEHAHNSHNHSSHDHKGHLKVGLSVVTGIFIFLCIEKCIRLVRFGYGHQHHNSNSNTESQNNKNSNNNNKKKHGEKDKSIKLKRGKYGLVCLFFNNVF